MAAASNPKRGLPLVQGSAPDLPKATGGQCSWFYNWSPSAPTNASLVFFAAAVTQAGASTILAFNEPDLPAPQANIPAVEAAQLWQQHIQPLKASGVRLGSPAFTEACTGCTIDFVVVHWYGEGADNFSRYLESKPIWVTEFAETSADDAAVASFMAEVLAWFAYAICWTGMAT
ncbi:hypothetical protein B0H10DRAFT_2166048 [Mycena sp. CBHHK59/15]|nr:hypothetical protein B0H10DRAFT_2166048 [Mycena sp. CBHHK59/15]